MGNSPTGKALLENADALGHICGFVEGSSVYRCRQLCKRLCESVDRQRCVSTVVFPSALIRAVPRQRGHTGEACALLPFPCWGKTGEFCCLEKTRAVTNCVGKETKDCRLDKVEGFIPVACLGSKWDSYRICVPGWLVQGANRGQIRRLEYGGDPYKQRGVCYQAIRCSNDFVLAELFDETRLQQEASKKLESEKSLMGVVDCLALWMHPAVFPRLEELSFTDDLGMNCPSQMYQGSELEVTDTVHWSCWTEYASQILRPLLRMNPKSSCGLKKLSLGARSGKLVVDILFDKLEVEMPSLTHLTLSDIIAFAARDNLTIFGQLPNLENLGMWGHTSFLRLNSTIEGLIEKGLYRKLRTLTSASPIWRQASLPEPNSRFSQEFPCRYFLSRDFQHPLPEQGNLREADFYLPVSGNSLVLPPSIRIVRIHMDDNLATLANLRFAENVKLDTVFLCYPKDCPMERVWLEFRKFLGQAPKQLLEATEIRLALCRKPRFR